MNTCLFVYGTLRQHADTEMSQLLVKHAAFVDYATCQGRLYKIDYYPGLVCSDKPTDKVHGEVYQLLQPSLILPQLDICEECSADFPQPAEYRREIRQVRLNCGKMLPAWVYMYNWPVHNLTPIPSGDFLKTASTHSRPAFLKSWS